MNRKVKKLTTTLLLDVTGVFDNILHSQLFQNLRKRNIGVFTLTWIASFFSDCYTIFRSINHTTGKIKTILELPQGLLLSPILYLCYNADLTEVCTNLDNRTVALGFIDNVAIQGVESSSEKNLEPPLKVYSKAID